MNYVSKAIVAFSGLCLSGCVTDDGAGILQNLPGFGEVAVATGPLTANEIDMGLREALRVGTTSVVNQVSAPNGFFGDPQIKIPLPETLAKVQSSLGRVGMDGPLNELELKMNQAAEEAAPKAKKLFVSAISSMTIDDAVGLLKGADTAATDFLRNKTEAQLRTEFRPVVVSAMGQVGALTHAENVLGRYVPASSVASVRNQLVDHSLDGAMDGLFYYLAEEEKKIRNNPVERTTQLLKRVFGS
jgi:hypothetical protein